MWALFRLAAAVAVAAVVVHGTEAAACGDGTVFLSEHACLPGDYNKEILPKVDEVNYVEVNFNIRDITDIDDHSQTVSLFMYLTLQWEEPRLILEDGLPSNTTLIVGHQSLEKLFIPDLFIFNLVKFRRLEVLKRVESLFINMYKWVIWYGVVEIKFTCAMYFERFPMDGQTCTFRVTSSQYSEEHMYFESTYTFDQESYRLKDYKLTLHNLTEENMLHKEYVVSSVTGFEMWMDRHTGHYVFKYYLPCAAMVLVAAVSFVIDPAAVPGRTALLVTLFLVLSTIFANAQSTTPKTDGLTALTWYIMVCILYVFLAMQEFAVILFVKRHEKVFHADKAARDKKETEEESNQNDTGKGKNNKNNNQWRLDGEKKDNEKWSLRLMGLTTVTKSELFCYRTDRAALIIFLVTFLLYNVIYTIAYNV